VQLARLLGRIEHLQAHTAFFIRTGVDQRRVADQCLAAALELQQLGQVAMVQPV